MTIKVKYFYENNFLSLQLEKGVYIKPSECTRKFSVLTMGADH